MKQTRKVVKNKRGEWTINIPKRLAESRGLKPGQEAEWRVNNRGQLEVQL